MHFSIMRGVLHCDQWFLNDKGKIPTIPGLLKFQTVKANKQSKLKGSEKMEQSGLYEVPDEEEDE